MKRFFISLAIIASVAAVIVVVCSRNKQDSFVEANIDALVETENGDAGVTGTCARVSGECMFKCDNCGAIYYTPTFAKGPSTSKNGICLECGKSVNL